MTTIYCDQKQCEHHQPEEHNKGICMAFNIELAEAPGGFWLSCRMKTNGKRMKNYEEETRGNKQSSR